MKEKQVSTYLRTFLSKYYNHDVFPTSRDIAQRMLGTFGKDCVVTENDEDVKDPQYLGDFLHVNMYTIVVVVEIRNVVMFDLKTMCFSFQLNGRSLRSMMR